MATNPQRAQAIADAILNAVATQFQVNRIGEAIAYITGQADHYAGLTAAGKAEFFVRHYRSTTIEWVRSADARLASDNVEADAESDLPESP